MINICIVGLGYVGLPLAELFSKKYPVKGFDIDKDKIRGLKALGYNFVCTCDIQEIKDCNFFIVAVPTPVDSNHCPNLEPLKNATKIIGNILKPKDFVVYESTVYPGVTMEECVPILEKTSGLTLNSDFYVGYSPERINPGDKVHSIEKIVKITSASCQYALQVVDSLYNSVLENGTYKVSSINVAEASKIVENCQRDVNIAFMNEISKIFNAIGLDTQEVIKAASTKWNFLNFSPGLVGGHCISVDPYYLIQQAKIYGVLPRVMTAARQLNDAMGGYVAEQTIKQMILKGILIKGAFVLILGFSFKENSSDIRNTKVIDIYHILLEYGINVDIYDPLVNKEAVFKEYNVDILSCLDDKKKYDAIILAVPHDVFLSLDLQHFKKSNCVISDVKGVLDKSQSDFRL